MNFLSRFSAKRLWAACRPTLGRGPWWMYYIITEPRRRLYAGRYGVALSKDTELVIEGYQRSGNSFALHAFEYAQSRSVRIGHHLHVPSHVMEAIRRDIPVLLIVRHPDDVVISQVIKSPHMSLGMALKGYISFYSAVKPYSKFTVIATFDEVTSDFGAVVAYFNKQYKTRFGIFAHNKINVKNVFDLMESRVKKYQGVNTIDESRIARPSEYRKNLKQILKPDLLSPRLSPLRERALELFNWFSIRSVKQIDMQ